MDHKLQKFTANHCDKLNYNTLFSISNNVQISYICCYRTLLHTITRSEVILKGHTEKRTPTRRRQAIQSYQPIRILDDGNDPHHFH